jgi:predicted  nucleic acid-binding Zn-ribbon protein
MKVCKLVRLTSKDPETGKFVKGEKGSQVTLRTRTVVPESTVEESESNCGKTGLLYIVDEKATAKRNAIVEAEAEGKNVEEIEVDADDETAKAAGEAEKAKTAATTAAIDKKANTGDKL